PNPLFRDNERFRIIPMSGDAALFWDLRVALAVGWFVFGYVTVELLATLGLSPAARELVAYAFGLGLLAIGIDMAWRRPKAEESGDAAAAKRRIVRVGWLLTVYFVALWLLWVVGAIPLLWLSIVVVGLPATMRVTQRAVSHLLRPPGMPAAGTETPSFAAICLERGLRALLVLGAALLIAPAFQIDLVALTERDTMIDRLVRGVLNGVVILLVADLAWHLLKTLIDRRLSQNAELGPPNTEAARRQARIRTLLPIMRNMLFVVVV